MSLRIKVTISNIEWEVVFENQVNEILKGCHGKAIYDEQVILIDGRLKPTFMKSVIIHELTHAFEFSYGYMFRVSENRHEDLAEFVSIHAIPIIKTAEYILDYVRGKTL
jgi:hypothetical protein